MTNRDHIAGFNSTELAALLVKIDTSGDEARYVTTDGRRFIIFDNAIIHEAAWLEAEHDE